MARNRFETGTGCYACNACGRKTRSTGNGDNENVRLCVQCWELAGIENEISDGHATRAERAEEIAQLEAEIAAKGGKVVR